MKVGVGVLGHVVVEHNVHPLDVHSSAKQIGGDKNPLLEIFELLVPGNNRFANVLNINIPTWTTSPPGSSPCGLRWLGSFALSGAEPGPCTFAQTSQK